MYRRSEIEWGTVFNPAWTLTSRKLIGGAEDTGNRAAEDA
jgi:hypothetical protein